MNWRDGIKAALLLLVAAFCLFEFSLHRHVNLVREYESVFLSLRWMLLSCLAVWCGVLIFLTRQTRNWLLIGFLLFASILYFFAKNPGPDVHLLIFGAALGKCAKCFLANGNEKLYLIGLILLLTFSSWWHLDMSGNYYHGPRWMGLWNNPNTYGVLMASGVVLATGLLAAGRMNDDRQEVRKLFLWPAMFVMSMGSVMSYSRGAWAGTVVGLLYLAKAYGKFKWRWVLMPVLLATATAIFFWHTPQTAPWYFQRLDLSRGSVQHRLAAWKAGFEIMRDHPLGVGWNKAVETYEKNYSPPEGGAGAITTNDYLMLGTQLGIPALVCFLAYAGLCFRTPRFTVKTDGGKQTAEGATLVVDWGFRTLDSTKVACRAGALAMLVTFWFDGGLFKLATAAVFWILLELGSFSNAESRMKNGETKTAEALPAA